MFSDRPLQPSYLLPQAYPSEFEMQSGCNLQADLPEPSKSGFAIPFPNATGKPVPLMCDRCPNRPVYYRRHLFK